MIRFTHISYKNILSVGQAPIVLDLSTHRLTALHGQSGAGKSLMLDAISFALFGRAFRDINKTDLVNSINGRGLEVQIEFEVGESRYVVTRGIKPNVFQILVNGEPLNQDAHAKDQQKALEDQVLKMNWKIFNQVVMLGAANYTPFMRLKPSERKRMVENILGIDVFSTMNAVVKTKISDETLRYKGILEKRDTLTQQASYLEEQQKQFEEKQKEELATLTQRLKGAADRKKVADLAIIEKEQEIELAIESFDLNVEIPEFTETFDETFTEEFTETFTEEFTEASPPSDLSQYDCNNSDLVARKADIIAQGKALKSQNDKTKEQFAFYKDHDQCPTCTQHIDEAFRQDAIGKLEGEIYSNKKALERAKDEVLALDEQIKANTERKQAVKVELDAFMKRQSDFEARKRAFEVRRDAFEARRREFEGRQRSFEARRRIHDEKVRQAENLVEEKRKAFDNELAGKRKQLEERKATLASILTEAKMLKEIINNKKSNPLLDNSAEIERLSAEVKGLSDEIDAVGRKLKLLREAQSIIKDDGVKSEILKRYIPTLNKHINKYLNKMGLFVSFELDQEFNDTIRSRHRDVLSYSNYSEGERQRLDLAVLLAWRHLAQAQSAVNTNLLILDEVLDSYLDQTTTESILNLMRGDEFQAFNIIVISHKEGLVDSFDRTLHFQKKNNFTCVA